MILPLEERIEAYNKFNALLKSNFCRKEIVDAVTKEYAITPATIYCWFKGKSPYGHRAGRISIKKELFYVIGALLGDGYIYAWRKRYIVGLSVRDKSFAQRFAKKLSGSLKRNVPFYHYAKRDIWFVAVGNAELFFLFNRLRKDLPYLEQMLEAGDYVANSLELLRGFIDAEGCVKLIKEETRKTPKVVLDISNKNRQYLNFMGNLLENAFEIKPRFSSQFDERRDSTYHHLRVYRKADVKAILAKVNTIKNRKPRLIKKLLS